MMEEAVQSEYILEHLLVQVCAQTCPYLVFAVVITLAS